MKFQMLVIAMLLSTTANAETILTADPVITKVQVSGANFEIRAHDGGLRTSGHLYPGPAKFESNRGYVLEYKSLDEAKGLPASLRTDLFTEARSKCQELGDAELASQSKVEPRADGKKFVIRGTAGLVNSTIDEQNPPTWATFVCHVQVTAEETAQ